MLYKSRITPGGFARVTWGENDEYEVHATVSDFDAGVNWVRPEDCYPPEGGEVEIIKVLHNGVPMDVDKFLEMLSKEEQAWLDKDLFDAVDRTPYYDDCGGDLDD